MCYRTEENTFSDQVLMVYRSASYLGTHPALSGDNKPEPADLVVTHEGVLFVRGRRELGGIPWSSVVSIHADDRDGVERRITATRVLLLGALAFVARKETRLAYLVIADSRGEWIFAVPGLSPIELEASVRTLQPLLTSPGLPPPDTSVVLTGAVDVSQRLRRLSELHASGLITDDEYRDQRAVIVRSL